MTTPIPCVLGLAWGFIDAASQLASVDFAEFGPTLPILFGRLRVPTEPDTIDYDAWELAEKLACTKQPNFAKARDKSGERCLEIYSSRFRWGCPGLGIPGLSGGVGIYCPMTMFRIRQPVAADPFDILETTQ